MKALTSHVVNLCFASLPSRISPREGIPDIFWFSGPECPGGGLFQNTEVSAPAQIRLRKLFRPLRVGVTTLIELSLLYINRMLNST